MDRHTQGDRPELLGRCDLVTGTTGSTDVALFTHVRGGHTTITGVLEARGTTAGLVPDDVEEARAALFSSLLARLAGRHGVERVDIITEIFPAIQHRLAYGPVEAELTVTARDLGREQRHFLAVSVDPVAAADVGGVLPGSDDLSTALTVIDEVSRVASSQGLPICGVVTPRKVGSLLQSFFFPTPVYPDPDAGSGWAGIPSFDSTSIGVETSDGEQPWLASVGVIMQADWPPVAVDADWLAPLVSGIAGASCMTVIVSHYFVPTRQAVKHARTQSALALANLFGASKKGVVLDGEDQRRAEAATAALNDVNAGAAGDTPVLRFIVYGTTDVEVMRARRAVEDVLVTRLHVAAVYWCDTGHARALAGCLPMGAGIRRLA